MGDSLAVNAAVSISLPVLHWQSFAKFVGMTDGQIQGMMNRHQLPYLVIGKHRFVNVAALTRQCLDQGVQP